MIQIIFSCFKKKYNLSFDFGNKGNIKLSSLLTYITSAVVLAAIPITVILIRSEQQQRTAAIYKLPTFPKPPSLSIKIDPSFVSKGTKVTINILTSNSSWNTIYFSKNLPENSAQGLYKFTHKEMDAAVINESPFSGDFFYLPYTSGYFLGVSYQLRGVADDFQSGDIVCSWDGYYYLYRRINQNPFLSLLDKKFEERGEWERIARCENTGPIKLEFVSN